MVQITERASTELCRLLTDQFARPQQGVRPRLNGAGSLAITIDVQHSVWWSRWFHAALADPTLGSDSFSFDLNQIRLRRRVSVRTGTWIGTIPAAAWRG